MDEPTKAYIAGRLEHASFVMHRQFTKVLRNNGQPEDSISHILQIRLVVGDEKIFNFLLKNTLMKGSPFVTTSGIPKYRLDIAGKEAIRLCNLIFDYFITKKQHAQVFKEYGQNGFIRDSSAGVPSEMMAKREELYNRLVVLNQKHDGTRKKYNKREKTTAETSFFDEFLR